jgi:hypothetical protein
MPGLVRRAVTDGEIARRIRCRQMLADIPAPIASRCPAPAPLRSQTSSIWAEKIPYKIKGNF